MRRSQLYMSLPWRNFGKKALNCKLQLNLMLFNFSSLNTLCGNFYIFRTENWQLKYLDGPMATLVWRTLLLKHSRPSSTLHRENCAPPPTPFRASPGHWMTSVFRPLRCGIQARGWRHLLFTKHYYRMGISILRRRSGASPMLVTSLPLIKTWPLSSSTSRSKAWSSEDLPDPVRPTIPTFAPDGTLIETSLSTSGRSERWRRESSFIYKSPRIGQVPAFGSFGRERAGS